MKKLCSCCGIEKAIAEFYKQADCLGGYRSKCKLCTKETKKQNYQKVKETYKKRNDDWRKANDRTAYHSKYREQNKDKIKQYFVNNRHISSRNRSIRRARLLQRTPQWLSAVDLFEIECIYRYCGALRSIGLKYEVDHIIPLLGKNTSGLHVPSNLQVIHMVDNRKKANNELK